MERYIDPKTLARVNDIPLIAKTIAEGFLHGIQVSRQRGVGIEFNQYRAYEPGDEPSRVDWKLFARSDRYYVREAERESETNIWFVLDTSHSMHQKSESANNNANQWNKLEYAKTLIATLSYIAQKQGDSIGYCSLSDSGVNFLPATTSEKHWMKLLVLLAKTDAKGCIVNSEKLQNQLSQIKKKSLIFVISDFYQKQDEIINFITTLKTAQTEVVAMQATCEDEVKFDYKGAIRFKDLESEEELLVSPNNIKKTYLNNYKNYQKLIKNQLNDNNIAFHSFNIDEPMDKILFEYLKHRNNQVV
ncbi:DUF58 domain-containing protein [Aliikangiella sp. IMCC44359]|uniref:DUF58 domain-containing protein n=1 Tax=Aliikangiella sp. IMCC44359 TaxID=3459125 RepID=UPI00403ADF01